MVSALPVGKVAESAVKAAAKSATKVVVEQLAKQGSEKRLGRFGTKSVGKTEVKFAKEVKLDQPNFSTYPGATDAEAGGFSQYDKFRNLDGEWEWPENDGFVVGTVERKILRKGTHLSRYGRETGYYLSPEDTSLPSRALSPGGGAERLRTYEVIKPLDVKLGKIAPAFGQPGGGVQVLAPVTIKQLIKEGYLQEIH